RTRPVAFAGDTEALSVTAWPRFEGLRLDVRTVVALALLTVCESADDELLAKVPPPLYCAVMTCVPTARPDVDSVATPLPSSGADRSSVDPSRKLTVPVGVPLPNEETTEALNTTV